MLRLRLGVLTVRCRDIQVFFHGDRILNGVLFDDENLMSLTSWGINRHALHALKTMQS
jgi:hypothetical protein